MSEADVTHGEELRGPEASLARHMMPFRQPLTDAEMRSIVAAGLATEDEFEMMPPATDAAADGDAWNYIGGNWVMRFRRGRAVIFRARHAPPIDEVDEVEKRFAGTIHGLELLTGRRIPDATIEKLLREPPWSEAFEDARLRRLRRRSASGPGDAPGQNSGDRGPANGSC